MTRRDLEEVITNLEYLLLHHFDENKIAEYERELQVYRQELRLLNEAHEPLTFVAGCASRRQH
jgi:hypothetical protein